MSGCAMKGRVPQQGWGRDIHSKKVYIERELYKSPSRRFGRKFEMKKRKLGGPSASTSLNNNNIRRD